jgi:hypothetical protein
MLSAWISNVADIIYLKNVESGQGPERQPQHQVMIRSYTQKVKKSVLINTFGGPCYINVVGVRFLGQVDSLTIDYLTMDSLKMDSPKLDSPKMD